MPIGTTPLNDHRQIPNIAYGTGSVHKRHDVQLDVSAALAVGFRHIDAAQAYRNEESVGRALHRWLSDPKHKRHHLWITTKFGFDGEPVAKLEQSLASLQLDYVDLYLIHSPRVTHGDLEGTWKALETAKQRGLAKSIGVSNFDVPQLERLLKVAQLKPAVNQIHLHPYIYQDSRATLDFCREHGIVVEAYGSLYPITQDPAGPVTAALVPPAQRLGATLGQVLFLWVRAKGAVIVTTSSKESRLKEYLEFGDLDGLTEDELRAIDSAATSVSHPKQPPTHAPPPAKTTCDCACLPAHTHHKASDALRSRPRRKTMILSAFLLSLSFLFALWRCVSL